MEKFLIDFLEHPQNKTDVLSVDAGPVITISRECGCSSHNIAIKLAKILSGYSFHTDRKHNVEWIWVNKEVIEKAAVELNMSPEMIKGVFLKEARQSLHEVTTAFSMDKVYDAEDQQVIDTLSDVIRQLAIKGNCIIVGRGSNILANDIQSKLRIKLQAPFDWRVNRIREKSSMSISEAQDYVLEIDRQRDLMVEHIAGRKLDNNDFDLIFNCAGFNDAQVVETILHALKSKRLI
ncbi:MAG: AAA family ATPase [Prolixibacteraceae bacterium]